jgi:putative flippase GtrA
MIRKAWLNEKVRYILIGAFNTFFGYSFFAGLWILGGHSLHYIVVLTISHIISVTNAFFCYRIWVFRKKDGIGGDFVRFNMVYLGAFTFNILVLPVLVEVIHFHPLVAQALVMIVTVVASYLLHRRFSFRLNKPQIVKS